MSSRSHREVSDPTDEDLFGRLPDAEVRGFLVKRYSFLAQHLARKFAGRGEPLDDLTQVANVGLLKAIDGFDPQRGVHFTTYATATIVGELKRHFRDKTWALRVPRPLQELGLLVTKVSAELWQELGRDPTVKEIASSAGVSLEQAIEALDAAKAYTAVDLDAPVFADGGTLGASLGAEDPAIELLDRWADVQPALRDLDQRERTILYLRFFEDLTQSEIAERVGISQMHVSRLLAKALEEVRTATLDRGIRGRRATPDGTSDGPDTSTGQNYEGGP